MENIGYNLLYGLEVAAVGLTTVFVALVILIALITFMQKIIDATIAKPKPKAAEAAPAPVEEPAAEEAVEENSDELVAVIAAAVAAAMEAEGTEDASGFVVRSIRRVNNASAWSRAGRSAQIQSKW